MRLCLLVLSIAVGICLVVEASEYPAWQDLLIRADSLVTAGYLDSADVVVDEAMSRALTEYGKSDTTVEVRLYREGIPESYYFHSYTEAESLYARAIYIKEKLAGGENFTLARLRSDLAYVYAKQENYQDARRLYEEALPVLEETLGAEHADIGILLQGLGQSSLRLGDYDAAEPLLERSVSISEKAFGTEHAEVATSLNNLANLYHRQGKYAEAEPLYRRSLAIREKTLGPEHLDVARSLNNLANLYADQGKYAEAEPLYKRALAILEQVLGPEHSHVAHSLNNLASLYWEQGKYAEAEPLFKRSLAIVEQALGPEHPYVAPSLNNLASLYWIRGKYAEAEPLYKRALAISEQALGPEHPDVARNLHNLANLCRTQGKYAEAEPLYRRSLAIWEKALGPEHPQVAANLNNLALLYETQGMYEQAEPLYRRSLAIGEKALGPEHRDVAANLNNLANLYWVQGKYAEAEPLYRRSLAIGEKALGPEHRDVAANLNNLANLYSDQGKYAEAEPLYRRALAIWEKALGPEHPYVATSLNSLAMLHSDQGKYAEAEPLYRRSLAIWDKALSPEHPDVAGGSERFSRHYRLKGNTTEALHLAGKAFSIRKENFRDGSAAMSEEDALTYSQFMRNSAAIFLSTYFDLDSRDASTNRLAGDVIFSAKGQVSDGIFERQRAILQEADSITLGLAESLRFTKLQVSDLFVEGPDDDVEGYRSMVDSVSEMADELEAELARHSASYRTRQDYENVSTARIASLLPENSVLVEYIRYDYRQLRPDREIPHYMVVILSSDGEPVITDLGEAALIDDLIDEYRGHMANLSFALRPPTVVDRLEYDGISEALYGGIWQPIEQHISGMELVLIAPDGGLNMISFAGLVDGSGSYLVERFPIHHLSSGRDVIRLEFETEPGIGLLALGDPDYDASVSMRVPDVAGPEDTILELAGYTTRNVRSGCGDLKDITVSPLPGTRKEVELIGSRWKKSTGEPLVAYFGREASEDRFKSEAPGKRVIHLATHGYFLEGACQPEQPKTDLGSDIGFVGENPLLLSGLFFAGANLHGAGADNLRAEDGILTAYEVSGMDLSGTEMVVLSACETGLGEVKQGEGVYGLRRAFQMAGARTVVSALWPVPDEATTDMMSRLYERQDESIPETMRRIQMQKINELRRNGQPDHPFLWAGFIALGDSR